MIPVRRRERVERPGINSYRGLRSERMKMLNFYAFKQDLLLVLSKMEEDRPVSYTKEGRLDAPSPPIWKDANELPGLDKASADQHIACEHLLIVRKDAFVNVKTMRMFNGQLRYDVEQSLNPDSVVLIAGGEWRDGSLIAGSVATISTSEFSQALMNSARAALKKYFTRVQTYWVGPEALVALRKGKRLTDAVQSPAEYDLRESFNEADFQ